MPKPIRDPAPDPDALDGLPYCPAPEREWDEDGKPMPENPFDSLYEKGR